MNFRNLFIGAFTTVALLAGCQEKPEVFGDPMIELKKTTVQFGKEAGEQTISFVCTRAWSIKDLPGWLAAEPAKGEASLQEQTVTLSTLANSENDRTAIITLFGGIVKEYITVNQAGEAGESSQNDGSKEHPYLASEANAVALALESGEETPQALYVKGFVKKFASKHEDGISNFGNALFYITDKADGQGTDFYCYQVYYLGGSKFTSSDQIKLGDEVIVYGKLTNYNGTAETVGKGAAFIYSLNGKTEDGDKPVPGPDDPSTYEDAPEKTVAEFLAAAQTGTYYKLHGTVSSINPQFCSFDLTDATGSIYIYSVNNKDEWSDKIHNGGTVTLSGKYTFYETGNIPEVIDAYILDYDASTEIEEDAPTHPLTSSVPWVLGSNSFDNTSSENNKQTATVNDTYVDNLLKLSTSKKAGEATLKIPEGVNKIGFYAIGWAAGDLSIGDGTVSFMRNPGCTGNAPYTITLSDSDYYEVSVPSGQVKISCPARVLLIGINPAE